jgi:Na+/H+ antiporter NhaD/arsenite permease-like protein
MITRRSPTSLSRSGISDSLKYAVVAGAVAGGSLIVIANASNLAGQSILVSRFGDEGISAAKLLTAETGRMPSTDLDGL